MIYFPDLGLTTCLDELLARLNPYVHLYRTDVEFFRSMTAADLVELDGPGYSTRKTSPWAPAVMVNGRAESTADPIRWTRGSGPPGRTVFGYFITAGLSGPLLWVERVTGPGLSWSTAGDLVQVVPRLTLGPCGIVSGEIDLVVEPIGTTGPPLAPGEIDLVVEPIGTTGPPLAPGEIDLVVEPEGTPS